MVCQTDDSISFRLYPFPIETPRNRYLYDPGTNAFFAVDDELFDAACTALESTSPAAFWDTVHLPKASAKELGEAQHQGFLRTDSVRIVMDPTEMMVKDAFLQGAFASHLVIELTDACNLRCKYCVFNNSGNGHFRTTGSRMANREHVLSAANWFLDRSDPQARRAITFYGGEPLLNLDILLQVVDHCRRRVPSEESLSFAVTTNGTLLDLATARSLIDRNVLITISLDGNRETHDWNRVFHNGSGSFDTIIRNVERLLEHYERKTISKIRFQATLDSQTLAADLSEWEELYREYPFLRQFYIQFHPIGTLQAVGTSYQNRSSAKGYRDSPNTMDQLRDAYIYHSVREELLISPDSLIPHSLFHKPILELHRRSTVSLVSTRHVHLSGNCVPGMQRIYVSLDGKLFPCERVDQRFQIGSLESGLDRDKIENLLAKWRAFQRASCKGCWAIRFCKACMSLGAGLDKYPNSVFWDCRQHQDSIASYMQIYLHVREQNESAYDRYSEQPERKHNYGVRK